MMGYGQVLAMKYERHGKQEGKLEAAKNALNEGLSMEQAARITGIPANTLKKRLTGNK